MGLDGGPCVCDAMLFGGIAYEPDYISVSRMRALFSHLYLYTHIARCHV